MLGSCVLPWRSLPAQRILSSPRVTPPQTAAAPLYHPSAPVTSAPATSPTARVDSAPFLSARPAVDRGTVVTATIVRKVIFALECTRHNLFQLLCQWGGGQWWHREVNCGRKSVPTLMAHRRSSAEARGQPGESGGRGGDLRCSAVYSALPTNIRCFTNRTNSHSGLST